MFSQRLAEAFDLTNRRLVYWGILFFLSLPVVGMLLSAGDLQQASPQNIGVFLKFFGFFLLYFLAMLFAWPFIYGGMTGELAHVSGGRADWSVFKTWAVKSYGRLLLFNLVLLVFIVVLLFTVAIVMTVGFFASGLGSPEDMGQLEEKLAQAQAPAGAALFFGEMFSTFFTEAFVLIIVAAAVCLVLTERGIWSSLGAGFKTFFTGPVFKLFLLAFMVFLFLNLLGVLVFNRPGMPKLFSGVYFVILVMMQSYFSLLALCFLIPNFRSNR
jgi:hypothetical protein